ncbi:MAG TPA: hypothetical protein VML96_01130 [Egibacteraceae bacterium]|nr:hypothetical protein [Egibacteraceae bacterium]
MRRRSDRRLSGTGQRWNSKAGAWLGIGAAPGALVLGAGIAARHDGPVPLAALVGGGALMTLLLMGQGQLGLRPPHGEGATLSALSPRYLAARSHRGLNALLSVALVGWFGFNVGLGGAAVSALLRLPGPVGPLLLAAPVVLMAFGGMRRWNPVAVVATGSALVLVCVVTWRLAAPVSPVTLGLGSPALAVADIAVFVGYVAVFGVRAPDFTVGLRSRVDLAACVALLVIPTIAVALAGAAVQRGTGAVDLVAVLAGPEGLWIGNLLVALAVVAPTFTTMHSGSLALRAITPLTERGAMIAVAAPGLVLAMLRFDLHLALWLRLLAAMLAPLVVPMALEGARRRRGGAARLIPLWTWAPASTLAVALSAADQPYAVVAGLGVAVSASAVFLIRREPPSPADR